jgi:hypothetical protein
MGRLGRCEECDEIDLVADRGFEAARASVTGSMRADAGGVAAKNNAGKLRGLASLMWPTKAWSGVSFACFPLRNGPNDFRCGARLALRRWRHRTSFSLRYRLGRYRKMLAPVGYPVNINKKRWRGVEISHGHGTRSMQAHRIDIRQSVASLGAGQIAALVPLI